jgi:hypothetical protein
MLKNATEYSLETNQKRLKTLVSTRTFNPPNHRPWLKIFTIKVELSESSASNENAKLYQRESWRGTTKFSGDQKLSLVVRSI